LGQRTRIDWRILLQLHNGLRTTIHIYVVVIVNFVILIISDIFFVVFLDLLLDDLLQLSGTRGARFGQQQIAAETCVVIHGLYLVSDVILVLERTAVGPLYLWLLLL